MTERTFTAAEFESFASSITNRSDEWQQVAAMLRQAATAEATQEAHIVNAMIRAAQGQPVSDFEASFPSVRAVLDAVAALTAAAEREQGLREENERLKESRNRIITENAETFKELRRAWPALGRCVKRGEALQDALTESLADVARLTAELERLDPEANRHVAALAAERQKVQALREYHEVSEAFTMGSEGTYWLGFRDAHTASLAKMDALGLPVSQPPGTTRETP